MQKKNYPRILMGEHDGEKIYLSAPEWQCDWYWGWGYLGNKNCHYHLDGLQAEESEKGNINLKDALEKHFGDTFTLKEEKDRWKFCELVKTFYALKETAEVLGRGGLNYTANPCAEIIKNEAEAKRINKVVLPAIFEAVYSLFK